MERFVGFGNFTFLFKRDLFWMVVKQSVIFAVTAVVFKALIGFCVAHFVHNVPAKGQRKWRGMLLVPFLGELAKAWSTHTDGVARVQPHPAREVPVAHPEQRARRVLRPRAERSDADAECRVVLLPVPVPPAPHLVDPPLRDSRAELRLVVHDGDLREVLRPPSRAAQAPRQVRLLGVDEELLVEEADLVERLTADQERGSHGPVDVACLAPSRLEDPGAAEREQTERSGRR